MDLIISARIAYLVAQGMNVAEAIDAVLGAGAYAALAGELCDRLNAKAS